jgi:peptidoglycan hydrolase-like protein with peptidoglycan-binding domain
MSDAPPPMLPNEPVLQEGDFSSAVIELQQLLNTKGAFLIVDGKFGVVTKAAIIKFQRRQGLEPDGIVRQSTWEKLRQP